MITHATVTIARALVGLLVAALGVGLSASGARAEKVRPELFGMDMVQLTIPPAPLVSTPTMRLIVRWSGVERSPGQYDWAELDDRLAMARQHGSRPLLTLYSTPDFYAMGDVGDVVEVRPPKLSAYRAFVSALARRYGDRADYQLWAEMNVSNNYVGTVRHMAKMAKIASQEVRQYAPGALVVAPQGPIRLPGSRAWFERFWTQKVGGKPIAKWVDVATLSGFPLPRHGPEQGIRLVKVLRRITSAGGFDGPIWVVEINYDVLGRKPTVPISIEEQVANVVKTYVLNASIGTQRVYWHYWAPPVPNMNTAMLSPDNQIAPPGKAFGEIQPWLIGTRARGCTITRNGDFYSCLFTIKRAERRVMWSVSGRERRVAVPDRTRRLSFPDGTVRRLDAPKRVRVGAMPVMIESWGKRAESTRTR
ncbi:hypothetical protein ASG76_00590 [Nocardioides sp. Soil774]|uniref:hypothetical protein n=1 Tax=Nocardioides sp. Soil774 TaxID=1736408 RepID=UPI0006F3B363|nr:hypothetical protein [Nocardioides sp. Soil774]KRE97263.1 hypothetical protein ASG76_00590 [Nocardioides sp. Soil774]